MLNICSKVHGNPSNSGQDSSLKTPNVNLVVAVEEKSEKPQSQKESSSGGHEFLYKISWQSIQLFSRPK